MGTMTGYRKFIMMIAGAAILSLGLTLSTSAQTLDDCALFGICDETTDPTNMKITCTGGTSCADANLGGTQIQITTSSLPTFQISNTGSTGLASGETGTAYLVVLVPNTSPTLTYTANGIASPTPITWDSGSLLTRLGVLGITAGPTSDPPIQPYLTSAQAIDGATTGFSVYLFDLGSYTAGTVINVSFAGISGFPVGTIFWSFLTDPTGLAVNSTAISQSLEVVPEPTTLLLFGSGLLGMGGMLRRRMKKKRP